MKKFARKIENFVCENCGCAVRGTGYTNHCPRCLYSKHVDVNPGDRGSLCRGLMKPIAVETERRGHVIVHQCVACGAIKRNHAAAADSFEAILAVSVRSAELRGP